MELVQRISTHAPHIQKLAIKFFNSRTPHWVRQAFRCSVNCTSIIDFNSRSPYGVRRQSSHYTRFDLRFQLPYPVMGATSVGGFPDNGASISTPAPAWGVTLGLASIKLISSISIHSPHEGYDCAGQATPRHMGHFNSHTRSWCVYRGISTPVPRVGYDCMVQ